MLGKIGSLETVGMMYRHLQLLSRLCNEIQRMMLLCYIVAVAFVNAFSLATLVHISHLPENFIKMCVLLMKFRSVL